MSCTALIVMCFVMCLSSIDQTGKATEEFIKQLVPLEYLNQLRTALLRACVTETPVPLCLDSKAETRGSLVKGLIPISVPAPQQARQSVSQIWSATITIIKGPNLQCPNLSTSFNIQGDNLPLPVMNFTYRMRLVLNQQGGVG